MVALLRKRESLPREINQVEAYANACRKRDDLSREKNSLLLEEAELAEEMHQAGSKFELAARALLSDDPAQVDHLNARQNRLVEIRQKLPVLVRALELAVLAVDAEYAKAVVAVVKAWHPELCEIARRKIEWLRQGAEIHSLELAVERGLPRPQAAGMVHEMEAAMHMLFSTDGATGQSVADQRVEQLQQFIASK